MAKRFRRVQRDQPFLLPPDMREWLPAGHLAWFVIDAVESLDVSRFAVRVTPRGSAAGRAAFDPRVLLGLLVYGYATGVRSSRRIERACSEDVAFRVICAQDVPDHATIARFRREHFADPGAMGDLFTQVLVLAARAGLGRLGLVALDGTKIAANASKDSNRAEKRLRELAREILDEAEAADAAEDGLYGDARGDELPPELADPVTRRDRIRRALADLDAERKAAQDAGQAQVAGFRQRQRTGQRTGCSPARAAAGLAAENVARLTAAHQGKIDDWRARNAASLAAGQPLRGCPPVPADQYCRVREAQAKLAAAEQRAAAAAAKDTQKTAAGKGPGRAGNITDPDSRLMPVRGGGFIQGFNAQAQHSADGLCLAVKVTTETTDYAEPGADDGRRPGRLGPAAGARPRAAAPAAGPDRHPARRCRVLQRSEPGPARTGPADRHRQAPRPGQSRCYRRRGRPQR